jgi:predicted nucleic acid-binding protein
MIVIADTGPLNYLILIETANVLQKLYGRVIVPQAVIQELHGAGAPSEVQSWISNLPDWLEVRPDPPTDPTLDFLGKGESAALTLAQALASDKLLIDDRAARIEAERRHLHVTGTVGVLADAHLAGLVDFDEALARLRSTTFRLHPDVERIVRRRMYREDEKRSL